VSSKAHLVVIVRCPLCGSWLINDQFRAHQDAYHAEEPENAFYGVWALSGMLEEVVDLFTEKDHAEDLDQGTDPRPPTAR